MVATSTSHHAETQTDSPAPLRSSSRNRYHAAGRRQTNDLLPVPTGGGPVPVRHDPYSTPVIAPVDSSPVSDGDYDPESSGSSCSVSSASISSHRIPPRAFPARAPLTMTQFHRFESLCEDEAHSRQHLFGWQSAALDSLHHARRTELVALAGGGRHYADIFCEEDPELWQRMYKRIHMEAFDARKGQLPFGEEQAKFDSILRQHQAELQVIACREGDEAPPPLQETSTSAGEEAPPYVESDAAPPALPSTRPKSDRRSNPWRPRSAGSLQPRHQLRQVEKEESSKRRGIELQEKGDRSGHWRARRADRSGIRQATAAADRRAKDDARREKEAAKKAAREAAGSLAFG